MAKRKKRKSKKRKKKNKRISKTKKITSNELIFKVYSLPDHDLAKVAPK